MQSGAGTPQKYTKARKTAYALARVGGKEKNAREDRKNAYKKRPRARVRRIASTLARAGPKKHGFWPLRFDRKNCMSYRFGRRLWTIKQVFSREARRRCAVKMQARAPPGTPLGRKTAVKKNARWRIPEKTHTICRKKDPFGGKASENRRETPVRKNHVCTQIYGARALKDSTAEHFRR